MQLILISLILLNGIIGFITETTESERVFTLKELAEFNGENVKHSLSSINNNLVTQIINFFNFL